MFKKIHKAATNPVMIAHELKAPAPQINSASRACCGFVMQNAGEDSSPRYLWHLSQLPFTVNARCPS
jgi:hypothetical protein